MTSIFKGADIDDRKRTITHVKYMYRAMMVMAMQLHRQKFQVKRTTDKKALRNKILGLFFFFFLTSCQTIAGKLGQNELERPTGNL